MGDPLRPRRARRRLLLVVVLGGAVAAVLQARQRAMAANQAEFHARYGPEPSAGPS